jgi:nucleotide-binding universal stress UspA family protein
LEEPLQHVLAVLRCVLSKDKLLLAEQIAKGSDRVLVAGQLCFPFLIARGRVFHGPAVADELITIAERMLTEARKEKRFILTPVDFTVVEQLKFERLARGEPYVLNPPTENVREHEIKPDQVICDIGTVTQWSWTEYFAAARRIFWHGPMGITETDLFRAGTRFLAEQLAIRTSGTAHCTVVCGSSLVAALRSIGFRKEKHIHLTSAGRTALQLFAGFPLPAVEALSSSAGTEQKRCRVLIPLDGSERDVETLGAATGILPRNAQLFLLHVRSGLDEEQYPDVAAALSDADRLERRLESERIFARANSALAACGLFSADRVADQGKRVDVITRHARRLKAELIVVSAGPHEPIGLRRIVENTACSTFVVRRAHANGGQL